MRAKKILALIPARGGSKGLPGKNIKDFRGKPLIAHTIEAALSSRLIGDVIVSTDDQQIYDVSIKYGARETFLRPASLAKDNSLVIDTYIYTLDRLSQKGMKIDDFVVLQPTSPLRTSKDIDSAVTMFYENEADSVISYTRESHPIHWHKFLDDNGRFEDIFTKDICNRQSLRPSYYPNGSIYVFKSELIKRRKYYSENSYAYVMPAWRSVDVDTLDDFELAEFFASKRTGDSREKV